MFLHLGGSNIIDLNKIIAVLNLDKIEYPGKKIKEKSPGKKIESLDGGQPKSMIITEESIILSPISSLTLKKRANKGQI